MNTTSRLFETATFSQGRPQTFRAAFVGSVLCRFSKKRQLARVGQSLSPIFCAGECLFVIRFSFEGFPNFFPLLFFKGITMGFILFVEQFERKKETRFKELPIYVYMYIFKSSMSFVIFHCNYSKKNRKNSPKESSSSNYLTRPIYETLKLRKTRKFGFSCLFSFDP